MVKGAIDRVLDMCVGYLSRGVDPILFNPSLKERIFQQARGMGNSGLRGKFAFLNLFILPFSYWYCLWERYEFVILRRHGRNS